MKFLKLLLLAGLLAPSFAHGEVSVHFIDGKVSGVEAKDEEHQIRWTVRHRSVEQGSNFLHGPVNFNGKWHYAIGGDVLTLSDSGQVVERTQFPAVINGLRADDDVLWVTLGSERDSTKSIEVPFTKDPPARGVWSSFVHVALRTPLDVPLEIRRDEASIEDWERELPNLLAMERSDLSNPMISAYLGLAYKTLGQDELVDPALERAIARSITWSDDLMVCGVLERAGRVEAATTSCGRAVERMSKAGLRPEAAWSLILMVVTTQELKAAMEAAVKAKDYAAIDRIAGHFQAAFPNGEASAYMWDSLGTWLATEGQYELSKRWIERARKVEETPLNQIFYGKTGFVDLVLLLMASSGIAVAIAGFALGIGSQRRRPGGKGWRRVVYPPTFLEAVSLCGLIALTAWASIEAGRGVSQIGQVAEMPMAVLSDNLGSPDVIAWLERFDESPIRTELLTYGNHELAAMKAGQPVTLERPSSARIAELIRERSESQAGLNPLALFKLASFSGGRADTGPGSILLYFSVLPGILLFLVVGRLTGQLLDRRKLILLGSVVPGSLSGALAPWTATAVVAGFLYITTPVGSILHNISMPAFSRYFGLEGIGSVHVEKPDLTMMLVVLVAGLSVHIASLVYYARSNSK